MIYLFRWIFGYVRFSFKKGFVEDFLSLCYKENIELREVKRTDDYITAVCNLKNYKKLHKFAYLSGGVTRIIEKRGLPFILLALKSRIGFFVGFVCFLAIVSFLNAFVWNIEIVGNSSVSDTAILSFLDSNLKRGTMWSVVDRDKLAWDMMGEFDELSWVHINKIGATARVEVNERRTPPIPDNNKLQGKDVFRRELSVTVSREQKDIRLTDTKKYSTVNFFTVDIPLYFKKKTGDMSQSSYEPLTIKGKELPIGITQYTEQFYTSSERTLSDDELKALAKKRMGFKERDELEGFEIVNAAEDYRLDDTKCVAVFSYVIRRK